MSKKINFNISKESKKFTNESVPIQKQFDLYCQDIKEKLIDIMEEKDNTYKDLKIFGLYSYVRGLQDGNRFMRNPNKHYLQEKQ